MDYTRIGVIGNGGVKEKDPWDGGQSASQPVRPVPLDLKQIDGWIR